MSDNNFSSWEEAVSWLLNQPDQLELVRACYYDRPPLTAAERFWLSDEWQSLRTLIPQEHGCALDVGAGMGIASYALARDGWQTTALEPDSSALVGADAIRSLSHESGLSIQVVQEWGERLPFADTCFDLVHARQVLHHASDLGEFCSELYRVIKPGGMLVATREHVISGPKQLPFFLAGHPLQHLYGGENAFMLSQYRNAFLQAGFTIRSTLGPMDSVINYAPFTEDALCDEIINRIDKLPGVRAVGQLVLAKPWRRIALRLLSVLDSRPGRLYTFICGKQ
jgi:SAM-dependent methyltransferase